VNKNSYNRQIAGNNTPQKLERSFYTA